MPSRLTPRSRNGTTVVWSSLPPASPTAATEQRYLIWPSTRASVVPPTASMQPAKRSDSSGRGLEPVILERDHREHRREPGRADRHGMFAAPALGQGHQPVALDPRALGVAAPMALADAPARQHHPVPGPPVGMRAVDDATREVDAGH